MRILSYNIRGGLGMDGSRSIDRIAQVVAEQSPDIVCFQEIHQRLPQSLFIDQPLRLEKSLGMPFVFQSNLRIGVGNYGIGMATRLPVQAVKRRRLTSRDEPRGVLEVRLENLTVFCMHWGLNAEERVGQADETAAWIGQAPGPILVCGDLNDRPDSASVQSLLAQTGLRDAGGAENCPTYPARLPEARIDYVFHSPELALTAFAALPSLASDHLPIQADFDAPA